MPKVAIFLSLMLTFQFSFAQLIRDEKDTPIFYLKDLQALYNATDVQKFDSTLGTKSKKWLNSDMSEGVRMRHCQEGMPVSITKWFGNSSDSFIIFNTYYSKAYVITTGEILAALPKSKFKAIDERNYTDGKFVIRFLEKEIDYRTTQHSILYAHVDYMATH